MLFVNRDNSLGRLEVGARCTSLRGHPHALTLASLWFRGLHVCQDNMPIELALVAVLSGRVEARPSVHKTLLRVRLALLPLENFALGHAGIKRDDRKRSNIS